MDKPLTFQSSGVSAKEYLPITMREIFLSLTADKQIAEDLFAKLVKRYLVQQLQNHHVQHKMTEFPETATPCWVESSSFVLHTVTPVQWSDLLVRNSLRFTARKMGSISKLSKNRSILLGAAHTKIHDLGSNRYNFVFKLSFTLGFKDQDDAKSFMEVNDGQKS